MSYKRDIIAMVTRHMTASMLIAPRYADFWYRPQSDGARPIFIGRVLELKIGESLVRAVQGVHLSTEHQQLIDPVTQNQLFPEGGCDTVGFLQIVVLTRVWMGTLEELLLDFPTIQPLYASPAKALPDDLANFAHAIKATLYATEIEKIFEGLSNVEGESAPL